MDKLAGAATFYRDNLLNKRFHLIAAKKGSVIEFDIIFSAREFKHLTGLHKLSDLPQVRASSSAVLFRQALNGEITFATLSKSQFLYLCEPRLNNFGQIRETLFGKELMVKSLHGEFNSICADYMLTQKSVEFGYAHLFLKGGEVTSPVTFIIHPNNKYLQNNPNKWTVLSVEEITK